MPDGQKPNRVVGKLAIVAALCFCVYQIAMNVESHCAKRFYMGEVCATVFPERVRWSWCTHDILPDGMHVPLCAGLMLRDAAEAKVKYLNQGNKFKHRFWIVPAGTETQRPHSEQECLQVSEEAERQ